MDLVTIGWNAASAGEVGIARPGEELGGDTLGAGQYALAFSDRFFGAAIVGSAPELSDFAQRAALAVTSVWGEQPEPVGLVGAPADKAHAATRDMIARVLQWCAMCGADPETALSAGLTQFENDTAAAVDAPPLPANPISLLRRLYTDLDTTAEWGADESNLIASRFSEFGWPLHDNEWCEIPDCPHPLCRERTDQVGQPTTSAPARSANNRDALHRPTPEHEG